MIRIVLLGRTGNNLFQYALGRVLAEKHGVPLLLDGSWFNAAGWHEVSHFLRLPLKATVVRRFPLGARLLRKVTGRHYWEYSGAPVLREAQGNMCFDPSFLAAPADCVLLGYFQTAKYFESIARELRAEINELLDNASPPTAFAQLDSPSSVAVHVRRGDFLNHPAFLVCDEEYYSRAMNQMRACVPNARFFIFSDDPAWCGKTFTAPDTQVINSGPASSDPLHDLRLMRQTSHHIIANSSYSWWAAWLGAKAGQNVIAPDRWFNSGIHAPIQDKLADGWTTLSKPSSHP